MSEDSRKKSKYPPDTDWGKYSVQVSSPTNFLRKSMKNVINGFV